MDIERIQALVRLMVDNDLSEVHIRSGEERILLRRGQLAAPALPAGPLVVTAGPGQQLASAAAGTATTPQAAATDADDTVPIPSPMVGTFYAAPSPDSVPYVGIGSEVTEDSIVCIVEAMKVMNELKAEIRGKIVKVLASNGQAVEYGQPLFLVKKS